MGGVKVIGDFVCYNAAALERQMERNWANANAGINHYLLVNISRRLVVHSQSFKDRDRTQHYLFLLSNSVLIVANNKMSIEF